MKKLIYLIVVIGALALIVAGCGLLTVPPSEESELDKAKPEKIECTTIQDGTLETSTGETIVLDYDEWGYNYQAHIFEGLYSNASRPSPPYTEENAPSKTWLLMKWNDAWLSNKSCDGDLLLDRHYGYETYIGSGAWCTNHQWGFYDEDSIVDELNIGDLGSEVGHNLDGWSDIWDWGGNYGNASSLGYSFRLLMGPGDGCGDGYREAYFTMNTNGAEAHKLILRHLDGSQDDNFEVYIWDGTDWELVDSYASQGGGEAWVTSDFAISPPRSGELKFKLVATGTVTEWCDAWGQVAFSYAELEGTCYWNYFVKIVAVPDDANKIVDIWYEADETEIGPDIWGQFAIIQQVWNDPCDGEEGILYKSPAGPGLGKWEGGFPEEE